MFTTFYRRYLSLVMISLSLCACDSDSGNSKIDSEQARSSSMSNNALVMQEHHIRDSGMNNLVAATLLVPKGWELKGGLTRTGNQLYNMPVITDITVSSADGRGAHFYPSLSFEFNYNAPGQNLQATLGGNLYLPLPESAGQWFLQMAQINPDPSISNIQLVSEENVPELTQQLQQQNAQMYQIVEQGNMTTASMGFGQQFDTQATKLVLTYNENGKAIEETVVIAWQYLVVVQQGQIASGSWGINFMRSLKGPVGSDYLNDRVLTAIVESARTNPVWESNMQNYWNELARIKQRGANQRQAQWQAHNQKMQQINNDISDIISGGYRERTAISDRGHQQYINSISEVTPYTTPAGETVTLPSFYDNVYTDGNGTYILNNDAFYNPNTDPTVNNVNWDRIKKQNQ